uniref:4F2 cell-surface antigen heavy chain-like n=1 Tax=Pristiophorus japonicus TaxID=55135 RepID=UPI00398EAE53
MEHHTSDVKNEVPERLQKDGSVLPLPPVADRDENEIILKMPTPNAPQARHSKPTPKRKHKTKRIRLFSSAHGLASAMAHLSHIDASRFSTKPMFKPLIKTQLQMATGPKWKWARRCSITLFWFIWIGFLTAAVIIILKSPGCKPIPKLRWWHKGPMYRIAVRSYLDTNGDGVGDLLGIQREINHIVKLNMVAVVIEPIYMSSNTDLKSDEPHEFKSLLKTAKHNDIKMVIDLTPNPEGHEQHIWSDINFNDHQMLDEILFGAGHLSSIIPKEIQGIKKKLFIILLFSMPGTPFIYYGDEIGLKDYKASTHSLMRWDNSKYAGFTRHLPWITPDLDTYTQTVLQQSEDPLSTLSFYQSLAKIRTEEPSLQYGGFNIVTNITNVLAYIRQWDQTGILIVLNFGGTITIDFTEVYLPSSAVLLAKSTDLTPCELIHLNKMVVEANIGYILKYFFPK